MNASTMVRKFKQSFDEKALNALGKATRLCRRERDATPFRLMLSLLQAFGCGRLDSIADIHRTFNALSERPIQYKPFHNQLAKPGLRASRARYSHDCSMNWRLKYCASHPAVPSPVSNRYDCRMAPRSRSRTRW